ncbi:MAG: 16S rRNA (uracil(1498)-N(3))-methyltransferase, partial [Oscillospiraceae bacterium]|nr:16S rRNA (uracil(1498)-N(3))-methyltransferase [Oscillospiraceae bacterium]
MARFFVETLPAAGEIFRLDGENDRHAKVLRLRPGEEITLCDGQGLECSAALTETGDYLAGETRACPAEAAVGVTLYLAFPKADKLEHVIQKAAELGAAELVAF